MSRIGWLIFWSPFRNTFNTGNGVGRKHHPLYPVFILATGRLKRQATRSRNFTQWWHIWYSNQGILSHGGAKDYRWYCKIFLVMSRLRSKGLSCWLKLILIFGNKLYFGSRMIKQETGHGLVPPEQHQIRDHNFLEVFLTKNFFNDMMRQKCWAAAEG